MKTRKFLCWLILCCASVSSALAQRITGEVVDKTDQTPVLGARVVLANNKSIGTATDANGAFSLDIPGGSGEIVISFIGYKSQTIKVNAAQKNHYHVEMEIDAVLLQETVVVGYGSQKKLNLTGAVSSVDVNKTLESRPIADVGRGLQGNVPGLTVVIPTGEVGSDPVMKIRGQLGSIQGSSNPLILMDNVEIPSIQLVNPDDIESISVLKDAASASIYGAKAAFGVVLITTKKGAKQDKVSLSYSNNFAWQNVAEPIRMGGVDALEYTVEAFERAGASIAGAFWYVTRESYEQSVKWQKDYGGIVKPNDPMLYGRDWYVDASNRKIGIRTYDPYDYMIKEWTPSQTHNITIGGKSGKTAYSASLGYLHQTGMMKPAKEDDFTRYNASVRVSSEITKWLTARVGMLYSNRNKRYALVTNQGNADAWYYLYRWGPLYPMTTEDGELLRSPVSEAQQANTANTENAYTNINVGATLHLTKNWTVDADYTFAGNSYNWNRPGTSFEAKDTWVAAIPKLDEGGNRIYVNKEGQVVPSTAPGAMPAFELNKSRYTSKGASPDQMYRRAADDQRSTINAYTTYNLNIGKDHAFKGMLGINRVAYINQYNWSQITQLLDYENPQFDLTDGTKTAGGGTDWEAQLGYFGRINYAFKDKYLLEGNLRYDGSSKFPGDLWWRWFPSFSAGWRVNEESFMEWTRPALSSLKLRGSWGSIGDQTVSNSLYVPTMSNVLTNWLAGSYNFTAIGTVGEPDAVQSNIRWQDIETIDLGVDLRMLNNQLGVTFDWYRRYTRNMLVPGQTLPTTFGVGAPVGNYGNLKTDGWEIALDFNHQFDNGLKLNFMATLSDADTYVSKYADNEIYNKQLVTANWYGGKHYGDVWGYRTDRLYQDSDFEHDANGKLIEYTLTADDSKRYAGQKVWKLKSVNGQKPVYQAFMQSGSFRVGPGDVKFTDLNGDGEIHNGAGTVEDHGDLEVVGNTTPRYEYGFRLGADWHGFDCSVFIQGVAKRAIWGNGMLGIAGYNSADGAMPQTFAGDFWKETRTDAFYPRPWNMGASNVGANMQIQSRYMLNMAYTRLKNVTVGYTVPNHLLKKLYLTKARVYVSLENFYTWDKLRGLPIDPEVINGAGAFSDSYNSSRTATGAPAFKTASFGLQLTF